MSHRHLVSRLLPARDQLTLERAKKIVDRRQREIAFIARSPPCSLFGGWVGHCPPLITSSQRRARTNVAMPIFAREHLAF